MGALDQDIDRYQRQLDEEYRYDSLCEAKLEEAIDEIIADSELLLETIIETKVGETLIKSFIEQLFKRQGRMNSDLLQPLYFMLHEVVTIAAKDEAEKRANDQIEDEKNRRNCSCRYHGGCVC